MHDPLSGSPVCWLSHPSCKCLNLLSTLVKGRRVSRPYKKQARHQLYIYQALGFLMLDGRKVS
jgi:hypothetical protein